MRPSHKHSQWLVTYTKIPTFHNPTLTATVQAVDKETARELVKRRLNDLGETKLYVIEPAREYDPPGLDGQILNMG